MKYRLITYQRVKTSLPHFSFSLHLVFAADGKNELN